MFLKTDLRLLSSNSRGNFFPLDTIVGDNIVLDELNLHHSPSQTCQWVIFEGYDREVIHYEVAGPSSIDAAGWRGICIPSSQLQ